MEYTKTKQIDRANKFFRLAANSWVRGNNSGNNEILKKENAKSSRQRRTAEKILLEIFPKIKIHYPGLYPAFEIDGRWYYRTEDLKTL